jgi:hypothetical protein
MPLAFSAVVRSVTSARNLGQGIAVYSLGCHGLLGFNVGEMIFSSKNAREFEFHGRSVGPAKG